MKKLIILITAMSLLLQSCYTTRKIHSDEYLTVGDTYKIKEDKNFKRVKVVSYTDSTITVTDSKIERIIAKKDIKGMKKQEFSTGKTVALFTPVIAGIALLAIFAFTFRGYR